MCGKARPPRSTSLDHSSWWFREIPKNIDTAQCQGGTDSLWDYTGISPSRPPSSGKPPSSQSLYNRILYHYRDNAYGSTFRNTVGVLLAHQLGIRLRRVGSGTRLTFTPSGEEEIHR
ncbi:GIY-YIG nuclease family protein [Mycolicibacterium mageritense]|uniref:GIY-YIG nuclease family protein n=1 Tax=Mycolicibacterium mageritense TaxID=53462 RepID=UPI003BF881A1